MYTLIGANRENSGMLSVVVHPSNYKQWTVGRCTDTQIAVG